MQDILQFLYILSFVILILQHPLWQYLGLQGPVCHPWLVPLALFPLQAMMSQPLGGPAQRACQPYLLLRLY